MRGAKKYAVANFTIHKLKIPNDTQDTFQVEFKRGASSGLTEQGLPNNSEDDDKFYDVNYEKRFRCPVTLIQGTTSNGDVFYHKKKIAFTVYRFHQSSRKVFGKLTIDVANYTSLKTETFEIESPHTQKSYLVMSIAVNFTNKKMDSVGLAGDDIDLASISEAIQLTTDRQDEWDMSDAITLEKRDQIQNFFLRREREKNNQRISLSDFTFSPQTQPNKRSSQKLSASFHGENSNPLLMRRQSLVPRNQGLDSFLRSNRPIPAIPKKTDATTKTPEEPKETPKLKEDEKIDAKLDENINKEDKSENEDKDKDEKDEMNDRSDDESENEKSEKSEKSEKKKKKDKSSDDKSEKKKKKKDKSRKNKKGSTKDDESENDESSEKKHKRKKEKSKRESDEVSEEQKEIEERKAETIKSTNVFLFSILTKQWDETPLDLSKMPKTASVLTMGTVHSNIFKDEVFSLEEFQMITNEFIYYFTSSQFLIQITPLERWVVSLYYLCGLADIRFNRCEELGLNPDRVDMFMNALNGVCTSGLDDLSKLELDENYKPILVQIIKGQIDGVKAKSLLVEALSKTKQKLDSCCDPIKNFFITHIEKLIDILLVQTVLENPDRCTFQFAGEWNSVLTILSEESSFQNLICFRQTATIFMMPSMLCDDPSCKPDICPELPTDVVYRLLKSQKVDDFWPIPNDTEKYEEFYNLSDSDLTANMSFEYEEPLTWLAKELKCEDSKSYTFDQETKMSFSFLSKYF